MNLSCSFNTLCTACTITFIVGMLVGSHIAQVIA